MENKVSRRQFLIGSGALIAFFASGCGVENGNNGAKSNGSEQKQPSNPKIAAEAKVDCNVVPTRRPNSSPIVPGDIQQRYEDCY